MDVGRWSFNQIGHVLCFNPMLLKSNARFGEYMGHAQNPKKNNSDPWKGGQPCGALREALRL